MQKIHNILLLLLAAFMGSLLGALTAFLQPIVLSRYYVQMITWPGEVIISPSLPALAICSLPAGITR